MIRNEVTEQKRFLEGFTDHPVRFYKSLETFQSDPLYSYYCSFNPQQTLEEHFIFSFWVLL